MSLRSKHQNKKLLGSYKVVHDIFVVVYLSSENWGGEILSHTKTNTELLILLIFNRFWGRYQWHSPLSQLLLPCLNYLLQQEKKNTSEDIHHFNLTKGSEVHTTAKLDSNPCQYQLL